MQEETKEAIQSQPVEHHARINWSTLRYIATSPKLLRWRVEHPQPDTDTLRLGRAIHCAILEPDEFEKRWTTVGRCAGTKKGGDVCGSTGSLYHEGSWYCRVRGHAPHGAGDPPDGMEVIAPESRELALVCAEAVRSHKKASGLFEGGYAEQSIEWTHEETGLACRGRLDYIRAKDIVDLKSTRYGTLREIQMDFARHLYYAQVAWYHDGAIAAGRLPKDAELPYIVAVSTTEPYDVVPYRLSRIAYEAGQIAYRDLLLKYAECQAAEWWPGIAPDMQTLEVPPWSLGMNGSEVEYDW